MFITLQNDGNPHHKVLTKELLSEHINNLNYCGDGKKLMKFLIMVGMADNKAQNPKLTKESLNKLDTMNKMLMQ